MKGCEDAPKRVAGFDTTMEIADQLHACPDPVALESRFRRILCEEAVSIGLLMQS